MPKVREGCEQKYPHIRAYRRSQQSVQYLSIRKVIILLSSPTSLDCPCRAATSQAFPVLFLRASSLRPRRCRNHTSSRPPPARDVQSSSRRCRIVAARTFHAVSTALPPALPREALLCGILVTFGIDSSVLRSDMAVGQPSWIPL